MQEYITIAIAALGAVATALSGIVVYGFWTGRWVASQESSHELMEERLTHMIAMAAARCEARMDAMQQAVALRGALADKEHAALFAQLDKLDTVTGDLQRQIDRRKSGV